MTAPALEELTLHARQMYSLPAAALEVLGLTNDPQSDGPRLKDAISRDPALAARVLRLVNSSLFGLSHPVAGLQQAVTLLGTRSLRLLALGFSLPPALTMNLAADVLSQYWRHALTKAIAAREIALRLGSELADEAFLAGLLADLGVLVLIQELGQPYVQLVGRVHESHRDLGPAERHALGFDHTELTARMMQQWGFPTSLIEAVSGASAELDESTGERSPLAKVLVLAELMTRLLAENQTELLPAALLAARRDHELSEDQFTALAQSLELKVHRLADILTLTLPDGLEYVEVLERARAELLDATDDAAARLAVAHRPEIDDTTEVRAWQEVKELSQVVHRVTHPGSHSPGPPKAEQVRRQQDAQLADHPLLRALGGAVSKCRDQRCALTLLVVAVDGPAESAATDSQRSAWFEQVAAICQQLDHTPAPCVRLDVRRWAIVLSDCDRSQAVAAAQEVLRRVRALTPASGGSASTVSVGSATVPIPPRNFNTSKLIESAARCLNAAQMSGGNTLKGLEIY